DLLVFANQTLGARSGLSAYWAHGSALLPVDGPGFIAGAHLGTLQDHHDRLAPFGFARIQRFTLLAGGEPGRAPGRDPGSGGPGGATDEDDEAMSAPSPASKDRRSFLVRAFFAMSGVLAAVIGGPLAAAVLDPLRRRKSAAAADAAQPIAALADLPVAQPVKL